MFNGKDDAARIAPMANIPEQPLLPDRSQQTAMGSAEAFLEYCGSPSRIPINSGSRLRRNSSGFPDGIPFRRGHCRNLNSLVAA